MERLKRACLTGLTFALTGPIFAILGYGLLGFIIAGTDASDPMSWLGMLWLLPFGYAFAFLPAGLSGLILGALTSPGRTLPFTGLAILLGAMAAFGVTLFDESPPDLSEGVINLTALGAFSGLMTGLTSSLLARRRQKKAGPAAQSQDLPVA
jgi:hypothetical protein